jgi:hypothetical protein
MVWRVFSLIGCTRLGPGLLSGQHVLLALFLAIRTIWPSGGGCDDYIRACKSENSGRRGRNSGGDFLKRKTSRGR